MLLLGNTGKWGFAYLIVPEHVVQEFLKLHSIELNGRNLVIEETKIPPTKTTGKNKETFLQIQSPVTDLEMKQFHLFIQQPVHMEMQYSLKRVSLHFFKQHTQMHKHQKYKQASES